MASHVFEPTDLAVVAQDVAGTPLDTLTPTLVEKLRARYASHVLEPRWLFNLAGGATGAMALLHASMTEYLVLFGTPLGTEGFSGRYTVDIHDWVLAGELWNLDIADPFNRHVTKAGGEARLPRGEARGFRLTADAWLLEYGRGNVPASLPHILGDAVFRGQDPATVLETLRTFGSGVVSDLLAKDD